MSGAPSTTGVDTPRLLNRWQLLGTALLVAFGTASLALQFVGWSADGRAADDTEQLVRVQEVQSSLLRADALATSGALADGPSTPDQRSEYDAAVASALSGITDAARAQPADGSELAELTIAVTDYLAAVARAEGDGARDGVDAASLAEASALLRSEALPILASLVEDNADRARTSMEGHQPALLLASGVVALVGLGWLNQQLARTFRRRVNVGVLVAGLVVLVTTAVTAIAGASAAAGNDALRAGAFGTATDQAAARTAANDAQASEGLRLVRRAPGDDLEQAWEASAAVVEDRGADDLDPLWDEYVADHEAVVAEAEDGNWAAAADRATSPDGSAAALDAYDEASQRVIDESVAVAADELRGDRWYAVVLALLTALATAAAVGALARGIGSRRREFA